jgi:hypothetical protein
MNPVFFVTLILATVAGIFFVWGTSIASVKHIGVGGIFLSIATILLTLYGVK